MLDRVLCKVEVDPLDGRTLKITPIDPPQPRLGDVDEDPLPGYDDLPQPMPKERFKDDSVYEFKIPGLRPKNGPKKDIHVKYITTQNPSYISLRDVTSLANGLELDDESVLYHIREACKHADYIVKRYNEKKPYEPMSLDAKTIKEDNFTMYMFIKYKALRDCLLDFYIKEASQPKRLRNQASDLQYEHEYDFNAIKKLLDDIEKEYEEWEEKIVANTSVVEIALRGKYSFNKLYPTNLSSSGYNRDRYPRGIDTGYPRWR